MPLASKYSHGIVKIGDGLNVTTDGLLTVDFNSDWYSGVKSDISNLRVDVDAIQVNVESNYDEIVKLNDYFERLRTNRIPISPVSGGFRAGSGASGLGISIGSDAKAAAYSVALGDRANANVWSVAIGNDSYSWGEDAVQLAQGRNSSEGTLQFRDFNIVDKDGKLYTNLGTETVVNMGLVASEQYVKDLLKTVTGGGLNLQVVDMLPTENISTSTIYLVPNDDGTYDEYVYVNEKWEQIGTTEVDLSNYVTLEDFNKLVNNETQIGGNYGTFLQGGAKNSMSSYEPEGAVGIGKDTLVSFIDVAIGKGAVATGNSNNSSNIAIGYQASAPNSGSVAIGSKAKTTAEGNVAIGTGASVIENGGVSIGTSAKTKLNSIAIGNGASAEVGRGIAIGQNAKNNNNDSIAIGSNTSTGRANSICIGCHSSVSGDGIVIGAQARVEGSPTHAVQIGSGANSTSNSFQIYSDNIYKVDTHTLTVQNIELNGVNLGTQLGDLNTALEAILGV